MVEELNSSELGTKEYWDKSYDVEINNYKSHGDVGEIWFDEDSQLRIIKWILKNDKIQKSDKILDLGCGNGMMLVELAREGFTSLIGVDYSDLAVKLASEIAKDQDLSEFITYKQADLLSEKEVMDLGNFRILHDKGTYDAISLNPSEPKEKRNAYLRNLTKIMDEESLFIITSCNWTQAELVESFKEYFVLQTVIPTPVFKFGGTVGNVVTSLVFTKKMS
ncbi:EEF1A lysine methyltransferase 2 [Culicoides brevitarsis]|uniref:EEF1A lysine methyltransferase 2 n=1 Tax=Culicoides brevitarsis TaxID=469753 RepID=UPI00307C4DA6